MGVLMLAALAPLTLWGEADVSPSDRPMSSSPSEAFVSSDRFVVHEWGTFTNFAGARGVQVDFRPLVDNDLPSFVYNRDLQHYGIFSKGRVVARQRMETPVTYFYTAQPREVRVRVDFPHGLLTEFFPPVQKLGPAYDSTKLPKLADSFLDWGSIRLTPQSMFREMHKLPDGKVITTAPPKIEDGNHYLHARETDSAIVEATDIYQLKHYEKFLFYRGVGNFKLPLQFAALGQGRFEVTNFGSDAVQSLFLVHIQEGRVWHSYLPAVSPHAVAYLEQSPQESSVEQLADEMVRALTATGLYPKEALAMVRTWRASWFGEEGTRLLYLVPARLTDEVLPLKIEPQPDETLRVLVGRMEVLTPEDGARLVGMVRQLGTCCSASEEPLRSELARLGRFAEPALEHLLTTAAVDDCRNQVQAVFEQVRANR